MMRHTLFAAALLAQFAMFSMFAVCAAAGAAEVADSYKHNTVTPLLTSPKTIVGEDIAYPGGMPADITAAIVTVAPGQATGWHKHGVPLFAYILSGELQVDYGDKGVKTYSPGTAFMEAMGQLHEGRNAGAEPARVLAVYMGAEGFANVIKPENGIKPE